MLKNIKESGEDQAEKVLQGREFYGGNFFDSLNPLKQVKETDGVDDKVCVALCVWGGGPAGFATHGVLSC